jgi:zinc-ribbon domain
VHPIEQCTNCGAENEPQNEFCGSCGAPLASSPAGTTGGTAVASDRAPSRGSWSMDRVRSLSTEPKREVLLGSMLAAGVSLLLVVSFYVLLVIRWTIGVGHAPGMGGLVSFVAAHGGALSVRVPPGPALFDIGGSLKIDPPITSIALLPFILLFVGSWMISRRLRTFVLFPLVATVCYSVILAVVALLSRTTTSGEGAEVTVSAAPLSAALHGLLIAGLGTLLGVVAARGPFLPERARQVMRGALVAVGASTVLALVLAVLVLLVTLVTSGPEDPLGNLPQDAGPQPDDNAQPSGAKPDGGVGNSIRALLTAIGGIFALLPASVGTLWLFAHGLPVGLQNVPDLGDIPLVGRALKDVKLSASLLGSWPFSGAWRLLLLAPVAGLVLGGAVAAHGTPASHRWRFGALVAVPYTVIVLLTAILASLSLKLSVAALDLDLAFRASLAWALLILPVAAGLGAAGALLARTGSIPSAHPQWFGIITAAACGILVLGTVPLVAWSSSEVSEPAKALAPPSATAPKSDAALPNSEDLPSGIKDVLKPPPAAKSDEPQGSQGLADSPEQRFVSKYYAAVGREDWDGTYSMLDAASKRQFTREEWVRKQQAHQEARARPPVESAKITNVSGGGDNVTATVELTHEDGTISVMPNFEMTQERDEFRRHLTPEDLKFLRSL